MAKFKGIKNLKKMIADGDLPVRKPSKAERNAIMMDVMDWDARAYKGRMKHQPYIGSKEHKNAKNYGKGKGKK